MLFYISPSKTMKHRLLTSNPPGPFITSKSKSDKIKRILLKYSVSELQAFYKVGEKVAVQADILNRSKQTGAAIHLFEGLVYKYLDYASLNELQKIFLDEKLLIASALYGVVSPLQYISPYRLDLDNPLLLEDQTLTAYWKKSVTDALLKHPAAYIVDLASEEYSQLIDLELLKKKKTRIKIDFKEMRQGKLKAVSTFAKMARGSFIRATAIQGINTPEALQSLSVMGYAYDARYSDETHFVYTKEII